jgi:hypothetical protein
MVVLKYPCHCLSLQSSNSEHLPLPQPGSQIIFEPENCSRLNMGEMLHDTELEYALKKRVDNARIPGISCESSFVLQKMVDADKQVSFQHLSLNVSLRLVFTIKNVVMQGESASDAESRFSDAARVLKSDMFLNTLVLVPFNHQLHWTIEAISNPEHLVRGLLNNSLRFDESISPFPCILHFNSQGGKRILPKNYLLELLIGQWISRVIFRAAQKLTAEGMFCNLSIDHDRLMQGTIKLSELLVKSPQRDLDASEFPGLQFESHNSDVSEIPGLIQSSQDCDLKTAKLIQVLGLAVDSIANDGCSRQAIRAVVGCAAVAHAAACLAIKETLLKCKEVLAQVRSVQLQAAADSLCHCPLQEALSCASNAIQKAEKAERTLDKRNRVPKVYEATEKLETVIRGLRGEALLLPQVSAHQDLITKLCQTAKDAHESALNSAKLLEQGTTAMKAARQAAFAIVQNSNNYEQVEFFPVPLHHTAVQCNGWVCGQQCTYMVERFLSLLSSESSLWSALSNIESLEVFFKENWFCQKHADESWQQLAALMHEDMKAYSEQCFSDKKTILLPLDQDERSRTLKGLVSAFMTGRPEQRPECFPSLKPQVQNIS